jgi:two-component system response regulator FlrC
LTAFSASSGDGAPAAPGEGEGADTRGLVGRTVAEVERDLILDTLAHCGGNRTRAAATLGISLRSLRGKLALYAADGFAVPPAGARTLRH